MTSNKDQKRLVRARMEKTGEAYTAARGHVVAAKTSPSPHRYAAPRAEWATLAGFSDDAVREKTGRSWSEWVSALDSADAHLLSHRDIARHVASLDGVSGWWAQAVTVGYERIRGLRAVGQRRAGTFEASRSRTIPVDIDVLYAMFADARKRRKWLPEGVARVRTATAPKSMRVDWSDGTRVTFHFEPRGEGKAVVFVEHVKLATQADLEQARAFWDERLGALKALLAAR